MDDVLICGAGPTGLVLALWLTKQGNKVRIIDKTSAPGTTSRAMAVQARTLELYEQLDLTQEIVSAGYANPAINLWVGGKKRAQVSLTNVGASLTPYPYLLIYPQDQHEKLLIQRLESLDVQVERNTELLSFEDHGNHVRAHLRLANGQEKICHTRYLAGCDGASSTIRHHLGLDFEGGTYKQTFYVADVLLEGLHDNQQAHIAIDKSDFIAVLPYGQEGYSRLIGIISDLDDTDRCKLSFDDISPVAIERLGIQVQSVSWFSTYKVHHRVTNHFRQRNVFLLGDAAHVHSPAGGQGMNTGIGDAINLAWKLTAVLKQQAPERLLRTYDQERKTFAYKLVNTTDRIFSFATAESSFANMVRTHIAPHFMGVAYRIDQVREYMFRLVSQTMLAYHDSPLSVGRAGTIRAGERLPWVKTDRQDNYEPLKQITWQVHVYGSADPDLIAWCNTYKIPLYEFEWLPVHGKAGLARDAIYLLRPDTYIAYADELGTAQTLKKYFLSHGYDLEKFTGEV